MSRTKWALAFGFLLVAGCGVGQTVVDAAKRRSPRECVALRLGDCDVATTQIWISQDGDVSAGSSWSTGEVPGAWGATDIVLADGVASQVSMTGGLDQSAITTGRFDVTDGYKGDLGLPGSPLKFGAFADTITMRGSGTLHYQSGGGDRIFVDSPNHLNAVSLPTGIILELYVKEGHVDVGAAAVFAGNLITFGPYATVTIAGSANTAPHTIQCWDGRIDPGLRGPPAALSNPSIEVGGGLLRLRKLTGGTNYFYIKQTGGVLDFDIPEANGASVHMLLVAGTADFRKCQYVFAALGDESYIAPGMDIIPGPATTEAILTGSGILDFRKEYP